MSGNDFEMTYPCYAPIRPNGNPYIFEAAGKQAIAICTDEDVLNTFFEQMLPDVPFQMRAKFENGALLLEWLEHWHGQSPADGERITHLLIDPNPATTLASMHSIADFARLL